ncbi:5,6-dimethylbenzimidazole synthase [Aquisalimonas asiatica]|uniref:Cob(II)yrinic acid a,c-diamide reductase n=1 Tax=Aquisalimonas asiatica TaxID=406100 RepID=A0A1H8V0X0_9GAMM|nr:5,6-dimethylbenzimidazole synthase [Aquisalimonas asiatica]SEP09132.1 cob(II)yrinic acid a,c-diamide reductase [Aquisalimonas asiatica]
MQDSTTSGRRPRPGHAFTTPEIEAVYRAIHLRRDMRHFLPDPVNPDTLARLLTAAHRAPSVGYMQPWRFVRIADHALRERLHALVEQERLATADALGERGAEFMRLKVEGIRDAGEVLVVSLMPDREQYVFGRRTLPEMDLASVACGIQNLWLAARAEGLGMGWVSLFDPDALRELLGIPEGGHPVAILCLGHVDAFYDAPMLEQEGWDTRRDLADLVYQDRWHTPCPVTGDPATETGHDADHT